MRRVCPGLASFLLPAYAERTGRAVRHAPVGVAERPRPMPATTSAHTPSAQAPSCAHTLGGPHHQAALRRLRTCASPLPPPHFPPPPAPPQAARPPPPGGCPQPWLPPPSLGLSGLGGLGPSPGQ